MMLANKNPPTAATGAGEDVSQNVRANGITPPRKWKRILAHLARGETLHRFQAERLGDHCLHSTIAKIQDHGISVEREWITVQGYAGHETRVCRYWLDEANRERACELLGARDGAQ